jgi:hypothetical protein
MSLPFSQDPSKYSPPIYSFPPTCPFHSDPTTKAALRISFLQRFLRVVNIIFLHLTTLIIFVEEYVLRSSLSWSFMPPLYLFFFPSETFSELSSHCYFELPLWSLSFQLYINIILPRSSRNSMWFFYVWFADKIIYLHILFPSSQLFLLPINTIALRTH